eukprot:TRINITY_DN2784_c0_g1_i1.p2 TRINITY_DN2784_c0_g1~~TRINITY_DN2784_c0_g1_i1.p2  ORF type:complete len:172 (+),score=41.25 TRINITY_DN2784_c0_g1_i1:1334-1849(+)
MQHAWEPVLAQGAYCPSGNRAREKRFHSDGAVVHVFQPQGCHAASLHPPHWVHDSSFWIPTQQQHEEQEGFNPQRFEQAVHEWAASPEGADVIHSITLLSEYSEPGTHRRSVCYRIVHRSSTDALCRARSVRLQYSLVQALQGTLGIEPRSYSQLPPADPPEEEEGCQAES